jgi:histidinol-phosphate phosphatase family protein
MVTVDIVIPTIGRASLGVLLRSLDAGGATSNVIVVDDRPLGADPLELPQVGGQVPRVIRSGGKGPAHARNLGWRSGIAGWVAFLDDDVVVPSQWYEQLLADLAVVDGSVAGVQGRVIVPLPLERAPTDRERSVNGLEHARWATADMAYRRSMLSAVGGFDPRFPRAFREDADLAIRMMDAGGTLVVGERHVVHPVQPAPWWISIDQQAGNASDALMRRAHGKAWRHRAEAPAGRFPAHVMSVGSAVGVLIGAFSGRAWLTRIAFLSWALVTGDSFRRRIARGQKSPAELSTMALTSVAIPFAAIWHRLRGEFRWRHASSWKASRPRAVLFDRDGTLIEDVPFNADPDLVQPTPYARDAIDRLRAEGIATAVITNQSGVARGLLAMDDVSAVNARVEQLLGPLGPWFICPHGPDEGCRCRKPGSEMVARAASAVGTTPAQCVVIGDTGADVQAGLHAGARAILVPNPRTRVEEIWDAPEVARSLPHAIDLILGASS